MTRFLLLCVFLLSATLGAQSVIPGFGFGTTSGTPEILQDPAAQPRALAFSPDGRLWYTEFATGQIRIITTPTTTPTLLATPFATVSAFVTSPGTDMGLHGICFDPAFTTNRFVYVAHTSGTLGNPTLVVKRFTEDTGTPNTAQSGSETIIFGPIAMTASGQRHGARIAFGPDGKLYVTVGDGGGAFSASGVRAQDNAQNLGKILRLESSGAVPVDNPTSGSPVFARGLRNPRGIAFNPADNVPFVTDSGNDSPATVDELNRVSQGGLNFGWSAAGLSGDQTTAGFTNPAFSFTAGTLPSGAAFYPSGASHFPAAGFRTGVVYVGGESTPGRVWRVILHGANHTQGITAKQFASFTQPVRDLAFGPDGKMYVATDGVLYRVAYIGNQSTNNPVANAGPDTSYNEGTNVTLSAGLSSDADVGTTLTFTWRQVGGSPTVTLTNATTVNATFTAPQVTFNQVLTFEVLVEDGFGGFDSDFVLITINNVGGGGGGGDGDGSNVGEEGGCTAGQGALPLVMFAMLGVAAWRRRRSLKR